MKLGEFLKTWQGTQQENKSQRLILAGLVASNLALVVMAFAQDKTIVMVPPDLSDEVQISRTAANQGYIESWALYLGQLLGNVTPGNADMVRQAMGPLLSSDIYQAAMSVMERQVYEIKENRVEQRFEPRRVLYEKSSGKVFVNGFGIVQGPVGEPERWEKTYEFIIDIVRHQPVVRHIQLYSGKPRTSRELERRERQAEHLIEKEQK